MSFLTRSSYTAGHFELLIDKTPTTAYLKSVEGGWAKHSLVDEPIGPHNMRIKHASVAEIDPITFEFGLSGANSVLKWIQESWRKDPSTRTGQITHGDFNNCSQYEHHFADALITETTFPALDGASKDPAYIKVKCQPEGVKTCKGDGKQLQGTSGRKQKMWLCSGFRLNIDGIDEMKYTNKIESFTIKQGCKGLRCGPDRFAEPVETVDGEHDVGRFGRGRRAPGPHGHAQIGGRQRRRVVDPVPHHQHPPVPALQLDGVNLVGR